MIFISYAKEDQNYSHRLYLALKQQNLEPWMDKPPVPHQNEGLRIGQDWERVLHHNIDRADRIFLILSATSVSKRGYVQREFRAALDRMGDLPQGDILVLPLLKEPCEVPNLEVGQIKLARLQWEEVGLEHIETFVQQNLDLLSGEHQV